MHEGARGRERRRPSRHQRRRGLSRPPQMRGAIYRRNPRRQRRRPPRCRFLGRACPYEEARSRARGRGRRRRSRRQRDLQQYGPSRPRQHGPSHRQYRRHPEHRRARGARLGARRACVLRRAVASASGCRSPGEMHRRCRHPPRRRRRRRSPSQAPAQAPAEAGPSLPRGTNTLVMPSLARCRSPRRLPSLAGPAARTRCHIRMCT
ncbi:hypothetical protein B0H17DRAFT_1069063 [Mycena rosella]|uniref:Uncharacterized protein n=1 Tax=Mycena rosella TaxID=1033263 RepID=A0AAD7GCI8_MYCRO|nr:hypothetical protein B0H17DRAFT_1069063 [Mycena rosella]